MKKLKNLVSLITICIFACCGTAYAKDNSYVAACKSNPEFRQSLANLHGAAQVDKHVDAICSCKYTTLLKDGILAIDIQKIMDKKYGLADPQMQKFTASEIRAGFQCLDAGTAKKSDEQGVGRVSPAAETTEILAIKGIGLGITKEQVLELFPQIPSDAIVETSKGTPDFIVADTFIGIKSESILSCTNSLSDKPCNKFSFAGKLPYEAGFIFIDNKLVFFKVNFNRDDPYSSKRTRANSGDHTYEEIKSAFSEKFKTQPKDTVVSEVNTNPFDPSETKENSVTYCSWKNAPQNERITLADQFITDKNLVQISLESIDYDNIKILRKKVFEEDQAKAKAEAERAKAKADDDAARKRKADL
jgi:hypothetical protein